MKKGFTLIELLAVIVILAIIVMIAVPRILDVINDSKQSAWNDNVKLIKKSVETDYYNDSFNAVITQTNCNSSNLTNFRNKIKKISDHNNTAIEITSPTYNSSTGECSFKIEAKTNGQFAGLSTITITCKLGQCRY